MTDNSAVAGYSLSRGRALDVINGLRVSSVVNMIVEARDPQQVLDIKARADAARAWARAHKRIKEVRLDLLRIEMAALRRIAEFGAFDLLSGTDRAAAVWLSKATDAEIEEALDRAASSTTAASVVKRAQAFETIRARTKAGEEYAEEPDLPPDQGFAGMTDNDLREANNRAQNITGALNDLVRTYTAIDSEFTIDELVEEVLHDSSIPLAEDREDAAFRKGVERIVKQAVAEAVPPKLGPTPIPRILTCRTPDGKYMRIPTVNARLPHLDDQIAIREEQLARSAQAVERLKDMRARLEELLEGRDRDTTPLRDLLLWPAESRAS